MTKIETMKLYGVVTEITGISGQDVFVKVKEFEGENVWEIILSSMFLNFDLTKGVHVHVRGEKSLENRNMIIADYIDEWGRICDVCGKWMNEGYYVGECNYACSEDCAIYLYDGDANAFRADLALLDNPDTADNAPTYWTEWE